MAQLLKPCPFCGGAAMYRHAFMGDSWCAKIQCKGCSASTDWQFSEYFEDAALDKAALRWNQRAEGAGA